MHGLNGLKPMWRTKDLKSGFVSNWDREWFYHFREGGYETIEWVEMQITSPEQEAAVFAVLREIHVPGEKTTDGFKVYGDIAEDGITSYV